MMNYESLKKVLNYQFDFEIGYLIKSPCKECETVELFPDCADTCGLLAQIHTILSAAISCSKK